MEWKKIPKKSNEPEVSIKDFEKGAMLIKDLIRKDLLEFNFGPSSMGFSAKEPLNPNITAEYEIQWEDVNSILNEVMEVTYLILSKEERELVLSLKDKELVKTFKERCKILRREIINKNIKRVFELQMNCKTSILKDLEWEIIVKRRNERGNSLKFPTTLIRMETNPIKRGYDESKNLLVFESDLGKIEYLIKEFTKIKNLLEEEENKMGVEK
ncbi:MULTISPECIES: hypothetical protein [Methanobacterium]|uniref:COMM domain-containing protein n=1 Tax=Methanobacterium bryantii TaxID=2161 RepID=A0A2A2H6I1_METBR|nr:MULTISPECIES: hypothetical protein [Methanobacterium]OEC85816.1 hypothetical protein A9507_12280 [Methanobacterium sp. A39]PAV05029.1 hypothetical protein ASJ80_12055 [Methanobacterium bryantii]